MQRMFDVFCYKVSLRAGGIIIDIIHWAWWAYCLWEEVQKEAGIGGRREFRLIWPALGKDGWMVKILILRLLEIPGSILISILLLAGILVRSRQCMLATAVTMGVIIIMEGVFSCYLNYFHQYVLTMRGHLCVAIVIWIRVWFFFVIVSLTDYMEVESRVHHINYMRDSFVLPFRREMADAAEEVYLRTGGRKEEMVEVYH